MTPRTCTRCELPINIGQKMRYMQDGSYMHADIIDCIIDSKADRKRLLTDNGQLRSQLQAANANLAVFVKEKAK